eukprot:Pgem_evm1s8502
MYPSKGVSRGVMTGNGLAVRLAMDGTGEQSLSQSQSVLYFLFGVTLISSSGVLFLTVVTQ